MSKEEEKVSVKDENPENSENEKTDGRGYSNEGGKTAAVKGESPEINENTESEAADQTTKEHPTASTHKRGTKRRKSSKDDEKEVVVLLSPDRKSKGEVHAHAKHHTKKAKQRATTMPDAKALSLAGSSSDRKKMDLMSKVTSSASKPKKPGGWAILNKTFNPYEGAMDPAPSIVSYDIPSQSTGFLATRSSVVTEELNKEHAGRTLDFGNDLLNRIQQKRKMAHLLMKQLHTKDTAAPTAKPNTVLMAFMSFWNSAKRKQDFLIPKDRAAWLEFLVQLCRRKTKIQYLSNKELKKVIIRTRPNLAHKKHIMSDDPDCPECFFWNENQVADWVESVGFPNLREAFLLNCITGRRLVTVDVNALRQMGLKYFDEMKNLAGKIRELLGLPRPNILRAIMRIVPFEQYLRKRVDTGKTYDLLNFETYCQDNNFDYNILKTNKNAMIPCTTEVFMVPTGINDDDADTEKEGSEEEEVSLMNAPTVEFIVRNSIIRNKIITRIIEEILKSALVGPGKKLYGKGVKETMKESLYWGLSEMGLDDQMHAKERLEFATSVARALLTEIHKTSLVLEDIEQVERYTGEKVGPEKKEYLKEVAEQFMEDVMPIAAVMALGELDLEVIFRDATGMEEYVDDIIDDAERTVTAECDDAEEFIKEVCEEAYQIVQQRDKGFTDELLPFEAQDLVRDIIEELLTNAYIIEAVGRGAQYEAYDIIAESNEEELVSKIEQQELLQEEEAAAAVTDFDNPEYRIPVEKDKDKEQKAKTVTDLQTTVDKEVKIGMIQVSTDKSSKGRKKRTELTVSDSLSKGRVSQSSSQASGSRFRRVESDSTLQRSPVKTNSASTFSMKSNSTGEFSVDSSNLRAQYSEAFKQIANERIQRVTDKSKLFMHKVDVKVHSVPNSPLKKEEEGNHRKSMSSIQRKRGSSANIDNILNDIAQYKDILNQGLNIKNVPEKTAVFMGSNVERIEAGSSDADTGLTPVRRSTKEGNLYSAKENYSEGIPRSDAGEGPSPARPQTKEGTSNRKEKEQKSTPGTTKENYSEGLTRSDAGEGPSSPRPQTKEGTSNQKEKEQKSTPGTTKEKYSEGLTRSDAGEDPSSVRPQTKEDTSNQKEKEQKSTPGTTKEKYSEGLTRSDAGEGPSFARPQTKEDTSNQKEKEQKVTPGTTKENSEGLTRSDAGEVPARPSTRDGTPYQKKKEQRSPESTKEKYSEEPTGAGEGPTSLRPSTREDPSNQKEQKHISKPDSASQYQFGEGFVPVDADEGSTPTRPSTKEGTLKENKQKPMSAKSTVSIYGRGFIPIEEYEEGAKAAEEGPSRQTKKERKSLKEKPESISTKETRQRPTSGSTEERYTDEVTDEEESMSVAKENTFNQRRKRSESAREKYVERPGGRERVSSGPGKIQEQRDNQLELRAIGHDKLEKGDHAKATLAQDTVTDTVHAAKPIDEKKPIKDGQNLGKTGNDKRKEDIEKEEWGDISEFEKLERMNRKTITTSDSEGMTVLFQGSTIEETEVESSDAEGATASGPSTRTKERQKEEKLSPFTTPEPEPEPTKANELERVTPSLATIVFSRLDIPTLQSKTTVHKTMSLASIRSDSDGSVGRTKSNASVRSAESDEDAEDDTVVDDTILALRKLMKEKRLHRRQLVENWAHEMDMGSAKKQDDEAEDRARIMRITADQIVSDIIQLALTHMLLQAEAGNDTDNLLNALMKIQVRDDKDDYNIVLWDPHLPQSNTGSTIAEFKRRRAEIGSAKGNDLSTKEGLKKSSKEAIAAVKGGLAQKGQVEETKSRRYNKAARVKPLTKQNDDEEITRL